VIPQNGFSDSAILSNLLSFKLHLLVKLAHGTIEELDRYGSEKKKWPKLLSKSLALACHKTTRTDESICNPKGDFHKHLNICEPASHICN
jgi:hypothetical protein